MPCLAKTTSPMTESYADALNAHALLPSMCTCSWVYAKIHSNDNKFPPLSSRNPPPKKKRTLVLLVVEKWFHIHESATKNLPQTPVTTPKKHPCHQPQMQKKIKQNNQWMILRCHQMAIVEMKYLRTSTRTMMKHGHHQCHCLIQITVTMMTAENGKQVQSDQQNLYWHIINWSQNWNYTMSRKSMRLKGAFWTSWMSSKGRIGGGHKFNRHLQCFHAHQFNFWHDNIHEHLANQEQPSTNKSWRILGILQSYFGLYYYRCSDADAQDK